MIRINSGQRPKHIVEGTSSLPNIMAINFKEEISKCIYTAACNCGEDSILPITGDISLLIDIESETEHNLLGVTKNVMDGMNKVIYTDDCYVTSVLIQRHPSESRMLDNINVTILNGVPLRSLTPDPFTVQRNTLVECEIETATEENYLPYQHNMSITDTTLEDDTTLRDSLFTEEAEIVDEPIVSIHMIVPDRKMDIDNVAANLIVAMETKMYSSVRDIKVLHLWMEKDRWRTDKIKAEIKIVGEEGVVYKDEIEYKYTIC